MIGWEMDYVSSLFNALYFVRLGQGIEDKFCWDPSKRRSFDVKFFFFYKVLIPNVDSSFLWKSVWRFKAPLRVDFFTWTTYL